jgi:hypothetical protein
VRAVDVLDHLPRLGNRARAHGEADAGRRDKAHRHSRKGAD